MAAIGGGEEGGDLAHNFVGVGLEGGVAVLFGERGEGERGADVDEEVEFLEVFEPVGDDFVFGAVHGGGEDGDSGPRGQVGGPGFAWNERLGWGAGALRGNDEQAPFFEVGVDLFEQAHVRVFPVDPA